MIKIKYLNRAKKTIDSEFSVIDEVIKNSSFNKTFNARVVEIISEKKCKVRYKNIDYIVKNDISLSVDDLVLVCVPRNNWNELYIQSGNQSDNAELITQITELNNEITELETEIANLKTQLTQTNSNLTDLSNGLALTDISSSFTANSTYVSSLSAYKFGKVVLVSGALTTSIPTGSITNIATIATINNVAHRPITYVAGDDATTGATADIGNKVSVMLAPDGTIKAIAPTALAAAKRFSAVYFTA